MLLATIVEIANGEIANDLYVKWQLEVHSPLGASSWRVLSARALGECFQQVLSLAVKQSFMACDAKCRMRGLYPCVDIGGWTVHRERQRKLKKIFTIRRSSKV